MFVTKSYCQIVFQRGYANSYSHQCLKDSVFPQLCLYYWYILKKCYLSVSWAVVSIYNSQISNDLLSFLSLSATWARSLWYICVYLLVFPSFSIFFYLWWHEAEVGGAWIWGNLCYIVIQGQPGQRKEIQLKRKVRQGTITHLILCSEAPIYTPALFAEKRLLSLTKGNLSYHWRISVSSSLGTLQLPGHPRLHIGNLSPNKTNKTYTHRVTHTPI